MPISRRIQELRRHNSLSLQELAELSGLDTLHLSRFEDGTEVPSYGELERLRDTFGVPLWQLFYSGDEPVSTPRLTARPTLEELAQEHAPLLTSTEPALDRGAREAAPAVQVGSNSNWIRTRIGQVALFWGMLDFLLRVQDLLTKSEMLQALHDSLAYPFQFLTDVRIALVLALLGVALVWRRKQHKEPAKRTGDRPARLGRNPILQNAGVPLFLAVVCGVSLAALKGHAPNRTQEAELTVPAAADNLPVELESELRSAEKKPSANLSASSQGQSGSSAKSKPLVNSAPRLSPAFDSENQRASILDKARLGALIPSHLGVPAGARQVAAKPASDTPKAGQSRAETLDKIEQAQKDRNWQLEATLCEDAIARNPQWLTAYLFAGAAYASMGQTDLAIARYEYIKKNGAGNSRYRLAFQQATELRESLRRQYGR